MQTYQRRAPEHALLYRLVSAEIEGLRAALSAASPFGIGLPKHVEEELAGYLRCGILAHGFARVVCRSCRAEHLVAFSCKKRGLCPSCTTRRMHDGAAHLVDRVLPRAPYRQWVVTFPRRVRHHLAADPRLAAQVLREVLRTLFAWQRRCARRRGVRPHRASGNGAVTFVQRFNSALELSLHFHMVLPDGVFVPTGPHPDARPRLVPLDPPSNEEVATLLARIIARVTSLLRRRGCLDEGAIDDDPEPQLLAAGPLRRAPMPFTEEPLPPRCARIAGYSLHAATAVHENDRQGLEQLCRYGLRPPLAQGRLAEAADGQILYTMKRRFSDGRHVLRFEPRELLLRLCALVPPRGFHLTRYAGIFAAHARGRHALTGRGLHDQRANVDVSPSTLPEPAVPSTAQAATPAVPDARSSSKEAVPQAAVPPAAAPVSVPQAAVPPAPAPASASSARNVDAPDDPGRKRRLDWAALLRRSFGLDVLDCPRCHARMTLIAVIEDRATVEKILRHLGLPTRPPPRPPPFRRQPALALGTRFDPHEGVDPPAPND